MNLLEPRPPSQVLIMSEESRLGREAIETAYALKQLVQAGRLHAKLADGRGLLTRNIASGHAMLRTLLAERIRFMPLVEERRRACRFEGRLALDRMIAGLVPSEEFGRPYNQLLASPTGLPADRRAFRRVFSRAA
jgi:hypothetical protein